MNAPKRLVHSTGEPLFIDPARAVVGFKGERSKTDMTRQLENTGLMLEDDIGDEMEHGIPRRVNHTPNMFFIRARAGNEIDDSILARLKPDWTAPVYRSHRGEGREG